MHTAAAPRHILFQPLIDTESGAAFAFQARVSGPEAASLLESERARYEAAIGAAAAQGIFGSDAVLALPVRPCGEPARQVAALFRAALAHRVPTARLLLEIGVGPRDDVEAAAELIEACVLRGMEVALDGFAASPAAMRLLARFAPRYVKLDAALTRNIGQSLPRQIIAQGIARHARARGFTMIAQEVATAAELSVLYALGVRHLQSHWIAPAAAAVGTRGVPRVVSRTRLGSDRQAVAMAG